MAVSLNDYYHERIRTARKPLWIRAASIGPSQPVSCLLTLLFPGWPLPFTLFVPPSFLFPLASSSHVLPAVCLPHVLLLFFCPLLDVHEDARIKSNQYGPDLQLGEAGTHTHTHLHGRVTDWHGQRQTCRALTTGGQHWHSSTSAARVPATEPVPFGLGTAGMWPHRSPIRPHCIRRRGPMRTASASRGSGT